MNILTHMYVFETKCKNHADLFPYLFASVIKTGSDIRCFRWVSMSYSVYNTRHIVDESVQVESSPVMSNPVRHITWKCLFSFVRPKLHIFLWCRDDGHIISEGMIVRKVEHNSDLVVSVTAFSLCSKSHCMNLQMYYCKAVYFRRVQLSTYYRENVFL